MGVPLKFDAIESWQGCTVGQVTITSAVELLSPVSVSLALESATLAVLVIVPQLLLVVGAVRCTTCVALVARVPKLQVSVPAAIEHCGLSWVHDTPGGSGSVSVTVPLAAPVLVVVMVN